MAPVDVLVVMARQAVPGAVKTRLAARIGGDAACALYRAFLSDMAATLVAGPWRLAWAVTPAQADLGALVGRDAQVLAQRGAELGERMWHCFTDLFAAGARRVVMIGADVPHLGVVRVAAAFAALDGADVVLTPTRDGGYCLVGQRSAHDIFAGVTMGGAGVFAQTVRRIASLGLRPSVQPGSFDVDEWEDVAALRRLVERGVVSLPATAAVLARLPRQIPTPARRGAG